MIANSRQFVSLGRDYFAIFGLDLIRRRSFLGEATGNNDTVAILPVFVSVFALVLEDDCNLRSAAHKVSNSASWVLYVRTLAPPE